MNSLNYDYIVDLLDRHGKLSELRKKYPEKQQIFKRGKTLGEKEDNDYEILQEMAYTSIELAKSDCKLLIDRLIKKIKLSAKIRLIGSLISSVSSAGLISLFLDQTTNKSLMPIIGSVIIFLSSFASLIAQYIEENSGGKNSLTKQLQDTNEALNALYEIDIDLKLIEFENNKEKKIKELLKKTNGYISKIENIRLIQ